MDVKRLWFESIGVPTADMDFVKKKNEKKRKKKLCKKFLQEPFYK